MPVFFSFCDDRQNCCFGSVHVGWKSMCLVCEQELDNAVDFFYRSGRICLGPQAMNTFKISLISQLWTFLSGGDCDKFTQKLTLSVCFTGHETQWFREHTKGGQIVDSPFVRFCHLTNPNAVCWRGEAQNKILPQRPRYFAALPPSLLGGGWQVTGRGVTMEDKLNRGPTLTPRLFHMPFEEMASF